MQQWLQMEVAWVPKLNMDAFGAGDGWPVSIVFGAMAESSHGVMDGMLCVVLNVVCALAGMGKMGGKGRMGKGGKGKMGGACSLGQCVCVELLRNQHPGVHL